MRLQSRYISITVICLLSFGFAYWQEENSPPKVTISVRANGNTFQWNSVIPYNIAVSDTEDGNTEYQEIAPNEVVLLARYLPDSALIKKISIDEQRADFNAILKLSKASCFNCHAAKAKLIGPSFEQISVRYTDVAAPIEPLTKKIIEGSTGTWSDVRMPPHPTLDLQDVREMVMWILKRNADPDMTYFVGIDGALKTRAKPGNQSEAGLYILTASYLDHGPRNSTGGSHGQEKMGKETIVLRSVE